MYLHKMFFTVAYFLVKNPFSNLTQNRIGKNYFSYFVVKNRCVQPTQVLLLDFFFINDIFYISIKICHVFHISVNRFFRILLKRVSHFSGDLICPLS